MNRSHDMLLPKGKTCDDCIHIKRCSWLILRVGNEIMCDWYPSKFIERQMESKV